MNRISAVVGTDDLSVLLAAVDCMPSATDGDRALLIAEAMRLADLFERCAPEPDRFSAAIGVVRVRLLAGRARAALDRMAQLLAAYERENVIGAASVRSVRAVAGEA